MCWVGFILAGRHLPFISWGGSNLRLLASLEYSLYTWGGSARCYLLRLPLAWMAWLSMLFSLFYLSPATCCLCWLLVVGFFFILEVFALLSFMRGSASSAPAGAGVLPVVSPVEDLGSVDLVDTGHFVREPVVLPVGDLSRSVLGSSSELLFMFGSDGTGGVALEAVLLSVGIGGLSRAVLPAHGRIVGSVWDEVSGRGVGVSRERLAVACAEVLVERGTEFVSAYTDALPIAVPRGLRGKGRGRGVSANYVVGSYGLVPADGVFCHVVGVSADYVVSDAVSVLHRRGVGVSGVSLGRDGWSHVGWLQWSVDGGVGLELGFGFGEPLGEVGSAPFVSLVPAFKDVFVRMVESLSSDVNSVGAAFMSIVQGGRFTGNGDEFNIGGALFEDGRFAYDAESGVYYMPIIIEAPRNTGKIFMVHKD